MLKRSLMLIAVTSTWLITPQPSLAALSLQAKTTSQKIVSKQFNAADAFSIQSASLRSLMLALYECQPQDLQKSTKVSKEEFVQWVFEGPFDWKFDAIKNTKSIEALTLSFSQEYQGDHVLPLIAGLYTMLLQAYGGENEFTFNESINPQKLTIAAQNVEVGRTKLHNTRRESNAFNLNEACSANVQQKLAKIIEKLLGDYKVITKAARSNPSAPKIDNDSNEFIKF